MDKAKERLQSKSARSSQHITQAIVTTAWLLASSKLTPQIKEVWVTPSVTCGVLVYRQVLNHTNLIQHILVMFLINRNYKMSKIWKVSLSTRNKQTLGVNKKPSLNILINKECHVKFSHCLHPTSVYIHYTVQEQLFTMFSQLLVQGISSVMPAQFSPDSSS